MSQPPNWRKSSFSFSNGNCTEVASDGGVILVRDTAGRDGPEIRFPAEAWRAFLRCYRADD